MPLPKPFSAPFQKNQSVIYIFFWGLDIRKAPQIEIRSYEELWNKYWRLVDELIRMTDTPPLSDYVGKNSKKEEDYQQALITLFETDNPELYPIPITGDTTLLLLALGWKGYEKEYKGYEKEQWEFEKDSSDEVDNEDDSSLDEPIVKPAAKPKGKTNLKPTPPPKGGKGGKGKVTKPAKHVPLPVVSLIPFPERKGFPYALLGDTKALKDYLRFPDSENKIAGYVSNVNGRLGPGWNLKTEAVEKIRESNGVDLELVEYESVWEYEKEL